MDISIIIINYNTFSLTKQCINSIIDKSSGFTYEIIVVDNSCKKEELSKLKALECEKVRIITKNENLGTSKANNYGASEATGDYLFFLNSDTYLLNNAIFEMYDFAKKANKKLVGGNLYDKDLLPTHSFIRSEYNYQFLKKSESILNIIMYRLLKKKKTQEFEYSNFPQEIDGYICCADLLIETKTFKRINGFDEDIFMYGDDPLLCHNARMICNEGSYIVPSAKIVHLEGGSDSPLYSNAKVKNMVYGVYVYFKKAFSKEEGIKFLKHRKNDSKKKFVLYFLINKNKALNHLKISKASKALLSEIKNEL